MFNGSPAGDVIGFACDQNMQPVAHPAAAAGAHAALTVGELIARFEAEKQGRLSHGKVTEYRPSLFRLL
jgi:hypothetical protein